MLPRLDTDDLIEMKENFTKYKVRSKGPVVDYQDRFPIAMGSLMMAGLLCYYAYEGGMLAKMTTGGFYVAFFTFLFFIGLVLVYIRWQIRILDKKWNWLHDWFKRLVYQTVFCWMAPTGVLFALYVVAYKLLSAEVLTSGLFEVDLPWIAILLLVVNLFYTLAFFVQLHKRGHLKRRNLLKGYRLATQELNRERNNKVRLEKEKEALQHEMALLKEQHNKEITALKERVSGLESNIVLAQLKAKEEPDQKTLDSVYMVHTQKLTSRHKYGDIARFTYKKPLTYLETIDGKHHIPANESSLVKVEEATDGFFRKIAREMAVPQHMMLACRRIKDGKLLLKLKEPLNCEVEISKESAPRLRDWILEAVGEITNEDGANSEGRGYLEKP